MTELIDVVGELAGLPSTASDSPKKQEMCNRPAAPSTATNSWMGARCR